MFVLQHAWISYPDNEDWTVLESIMDLMITDLLILAKKERAPAHFTVVSALHSIAGYGICVNTSAICMLLAYNNCSSIAREH